MDFVLRACASKIKIYMIFQWATKSLLYVGLLKIYKPYYQVRELLTLCWLTADWVADLYSQSSHLKGFSPVCCLMWSFNLSLDGRRFAHTEQVYSNNDKCLCFLIPKIKNDCMLCFITLLRISRWISILVSLLEIFLPMLIEHCLCWEPFITQVALIYAIRCIAQVRMLCIIML